MLPFRVIRSGVLLAGLLATLGTPLRASDGGFTATLSREQRVAAGLDQLNAEETAALDRLVAADLAEARELQVPRLRESFIARRSEAERKEAGLDRLSPEQLAKLDELVAAALAARPVPKDRPRLKDSDVRSATGRLQVHGGVSMTYGTGGGRSFRGVSSWVNYYDPVTGIGLGVGLARASGDGLYGYYPYPYYYGAGYYDAPVYYGYAQRLGGLGAVTPEPGYGAEAVRMDRVMSRGDGSMLRGPGGYGGRRH
jgi:hypothetical protein